MNGWFDNFYNYLLGAESQSSREVREQKQILFEEGRRHWCKNLGLLDSVALMARPQTELATLQRSLLVLTDQGRLVRQFIEYDVPMQKLYK